jgi:hypothetical protein
LQAGDKANFRPAVSVLISLLLDLTMDELFRHYFAPDTLEWEDMGIGYSQFVEWTLDSEAHSKFYLDYQWPDWQTEVRHHGPLLYNS